MIKTVTALAAVFALSGCGALGYGQEGPNETPAGQSTQPAQSTESPRPGQSTESAQSAQSPQSPQSSQSTESPQEQASQPEYAGQADQPKVLKVQRVDGFTPLVTSATGRTVYRFDDDSANPSRTTCLDECAKTWEPVLAGSGVVVDGGGIDESRLGTVDRPEGKQVTLKGWPLYYYKDDVQFGQTQGHGIGDVWFAVNPQGGKAKRTNGEASTAPGDAPGVQVLTVNTVDGFMPFVTNGKGRTIYRFDDDSANPSRTTCFGSCAQTWEPVLAGSNGFAVKGSRINAADVSTIDRPEGKQLTLKGWPLYYFAKDKTLGQTSGHGKGNVWFAIAPNGKKAQRCP